MSKSRKVRVVLKSQFTFEVDDRYNEIITFKGAFENKLIKVVACDILVSSDNGEVLNDEALKDKIIQAILYGLQEKG